MTEQLKPCPFCNAQPVLYDLLDTHGGFSVECPTVGCDTDKMKRTKAEVVEAWNRRAQPAQAVPVLTHRETLEEWTNTTLEPCTHQESFVRGARWAERAVRAKMGVAVPMTESLHTFLDAAAGEGFVLNGVDAADLYIALFPERYRGIVGKEGA